MALPPYLMTMVLPWYLLECKGSPPKTGGPFLRSSYTLLAASTLAPAFVFHQDGLLPSSLRDATSLKEGGFQAPSVRGLSPQATGGVPLSSIIPVDLHIIISQITAPCLGAGIAGTHIHLDKDIMLRQNFGGLVLAVGVVGGVLADIDLTGGTAQPDADLVDGESPGV